MNDAKLAAGLRRRRVRRLRYVRRRLTFLIYVAVMVSSLLTLLLSVLISNDLIFQRDPETIRVMLFGFAAKDILLLVLCILAVVITVLITSRSTANPILELTRAAREIAAGNFDVKVDTRGDHIREFGELQRSFNLMARELRSNEYLRKDFIANISHELKTPLSVIGGYARLLEEGGLREEEQREYARLIAAESRRLSDMVGNMLHLTRIENRQIQPRLLPFPLGEQLRQAILLLEPRWSAAALELEADIADTDYTGDAELLGHVWSNLLDNAVKFTPEGGRISVTLRDSPETVTVSVSDTGPGMDAATAARIFEPFYQGDSSRKREGCGLGLPLVRRITELHGGSVTVESTPGAGSTFTVTLPRANPFTQGSL